MGDSGVAHGHSLISAVAAQRLARHTRSLSTPTVSAGGLREEKLFFGSSRDSSRSLSICRSRSSRISRSRCLSLSRSRSRSRSTPRGLCASGGLCALNVNVMSGFLLVLKISMRTRVIARVCCIPLLQRHSMEQCRRSILAGISNHMNTRLCREGESWSRSLRRDLVHRAT